MSSTLSRFRSFATGVLAVAVPAALAVAAAAPAASARPHGHGPENEFRQTNLVCNLNTVGAQVVDPNLVNPWGLALGPTTPLWVADNGTSVATVYTVSPGGAMVSNFGLTVTLPPADSAPTGQVFNPTGDFVVTSKAGMGPALFIFSSEGGQIIAWNPKADPIVNGASTAQTEFGSKTAVYKGLAIASTRFGTFLYASNFHDNRVDVFNTRFHRVHLFGDFRDRHLPPGYAPFGIREIHGFLYVTYAKQDAAKHDDVSGPGHGFVDVFDTNGNLIRRLVSRGQLNSPWGLVLAPANFGKFSKDLLVGNFGDGHINAFDPKTGAFLGALRDQRSRVIVIDGLWALVFGNGNLAGPTNTLFFTAGIADEAHGLFGTISAA